MIIMQEFDEVFTNYIHYIQYIFRNQRKISSKTYDRNSSTGLVTVPLPLAMLWHLHQLS